MRYSYLLLSFLLLNSAAEAQQLVIPHSRRYDYSQQRRVAKQHRREVKQNQQQIYRNFRLKQRDLRRGRREHRHQQQVLNRLKKKRLVPPTRATVIYQ